MMLQRFKYRDLLFAVAFVLALGLRLAGAAQLPLNDAEASLALQALEGSRGQQPLLGPHPLYLALTTAWMFLFSPNNWVARFWPALAGSILVWMPLFFRRWLGKLPAIVLAFALAIDPLLLAASRTADSRSLALLCSVLAAGLLLTRQFLPAGIAIGLALLSGPSLWPGWLAVGAAIWIERRLARSRLTGAPGMEQQAEKPGLIPASSWQPLIIGALVTVFLAGTLFFSMPRGLSSMAGSLLAYLAGWASLSGGSAGIVFLIFGSYEFLPLILGGWGGLTGLVRKNTVDRFLIIWAGLAVLLVLLYPDRQVADLTWAVLPLWALAARQVIRLVKLPAHDRLPILGQMLLAGGILIFIAMNLVSFSNQLQTPDSTKYGIRLVGGVVMLLASTGLIAWGWSRWVALRGLALGVGAVLVVYTLSAAINASALSSHRSIDLLTNAGQVAGADLIQSNLQVFRHSGPVEPGGPDVVVAGVPAPALRWLLRDVTRIDFVDQLPTSADPAVVITPEQPELALSASYRGEGITLAQNADWNQLQLADWFRWTVFRTIPGEAVQAERIILWARVDQFPGGQMPEKNGQ